MKFKDYIMKIKWKKQQAFRGFSDYDSYEINTWFLTVMPKILDVLITRTISYPTSFEDDYCKENNLDPKKLNEEQRVQMENSCLLKWKNILIEMRNEFDKAMADSSSYNDKNNDAYNETILYERREISKKKALNMFVKYFDELWY